MPLREDGAGHRVTIRSFPAARLMGARPDGDAFVMSAPDDPLQCPRCGRRARALDLTASSITCADCDPAWDAVRHGQHPPFTESFEDLVPEEEPKS